MAMLFAPALPLTRERFEDVERFIVERKAAGAGA